MIRFYREQDDDGSRMCQVYACLLGDVEEFLGVFPEAERISASEARTIFEEDDAASLFDDGEDPAPTDWESARRNCIRSTRRLISLAN